MLEPLLAIVCGLFGGFAQASLSGRLVKPGKTENENGETIYKLGFLRPLIVGVAAGLASWLFNASLLNPGIDLRPLGWALAAGFAGEVTLDFYSGQRYGTTGGQERQETGGVIDEVAATANATANITSRELERAHEERRQALQRVAELEAEVDRLKAEIDRLRNSSASGD
jgi:hypothetical protein